MKTIIAINAVRVSLSLTVSPRLSVSQTVSVPQRLSVIKVAGVTVCHQYISIRHLPSC